VRPAAVAPAAMAAASSRNRASAGATPNRSHASGRWRVGLAEPDVGGDERHVGAEGADGRAEAVRPAGELVGHDGGRDALRPGVVRRAVIGALHSTAPRRKCGLRGSMSALAPGVRSSTQRSRSSSPTSPRSQRCGSESPSPSCSTASWSASAASLASKGAPSTWRRNSSTSGHRQGAGGVEHHGSQRHDAMLPPVAGATTPFGPPPGHARASCARRVSSRCHARTTAGLVGGTADRRSRPGTDP
jgi:hypothetical protein